jgi:protein-tyrosine-phosphatase
MAAAFLEHLGTGEIEVHSAGTAPADALDPIVIEAMREAGIDVTDATPQILTDDTVRVSDVVVTMGCGDACPVFPGTRYLDWALEDPAGQNLSVVRDIRDEVRHRVELLLAELPIDAT